MLNAFERSVKCESDTLFINNWLTRLVDPDRTTMLPSMVLESGNLFSNPKVGMPKAFKSKVNDLKQDVKNVPSEYKQHAKHIVKLYEDRKIGNFATAEMQFQSLQIQGTSSRVKLMKFILGSLQNMKPHCH